MYDVIVVGGGIIGAATAHELSKYELNVLVLEKENDVATGTSRANSGIIHAGYDPVPGTLMARLNVQGSRMAKRLCSDLDVLYEQCGSLVLAFSDADCDAIRELYRRGMKNGVESLEIIGSEELRRIEPNVSREAVEALLAPTAAIVNPWEYTLALMETAVVNGVRLELNSPVTGIERIRGGGYIVYTPRESYRTRYIVNAAGVDTDSIRNMVAPPDYTIVPDRGEYYLLDKSEGGVVGHVLFQCATPLGKGTLVAPTVHGNVIVGPNNERPPHRRDVSTTADGLAEVAARALRSVPSLNLKSNIRNFSGIRAVADSKDDFIIEEAGDAPGFVDLAGIKSPGLSAAPAIACMAVEIMQRSGLSSQRKATHVGRRKQTRFNRLSAEEKRLVAATNPLFGKVICRCETVTEAEILEALNSPIPPRSVDGVKRRCGCGMGRCQGGFCSPRVMGILAASMGIPLMDVPQDVEGTQILTGTTKG